MKMKWKMAGNALCLLTVGGSISSKAPVMKARVSILVHDAHQGRRKRVRYSLPALQQPLPGLFSRRNNPIGDQPAATGSDVSKLFQIGMILLCIAEAHFCAENFG
jgi:hypothetical protein